MYPSIGEKRKALAALTREQAEERLSEATTETTVAVCLGCINRSEGRHTVGYVHVDQPCVRCAAPTGQRYLYDVLEPHYEAVMGLGQYTSSYSTCTALVRPFRLVLDVNCWYRDLGLRPGASLREIRQRVIEIGESRTARQTHCVKMLMNPSVKERYDAMRLGTMWRDHYVEEALRRKEQEDISRRIRRGEEPDDVIADVMGMSAEDFFEGKQHAEEEQDPFEVPEDPEEPLEEPEDERPSGEGPPVTFVYALWNCIDLPHAAERWRSALIEAASERGIEREITVGLHGQPGIIVTERRVDMRDAIMLSVDSLDAMSQVAAMVVATWE